MCSFLCCFRFIKMNNYFDVYVGNLAVSTSREQLRELFCQFGEIENVWVKDFPERYTFTYGFISFYNLRDARQACALMNNKNLDGFILKVRISVKTQQRIAGCILKRTDQSVIRNDQTNRSLLRNEHESIKEKHLRNILTDQIVETQKLDNKFIPSFRKAVGEMKDIPPKVSCSNIVNTPQEANLEELESIVLRYYEPLNKNKNYLKKIDLDLSHGKVLSEEESQKYFGF